MQPAQSVDVARALCEALGIELLSGIKSITLTADAGGTPTVRIERYIGSEQVTELRELLSAFKGAATPVPKPIGYLDRYNIFYHQRVPGLEMRSIYA